MIINNLKASIVILFTTGLFILACSDDNPEPMENPMFNLLSLSADGIDLAGVNAAIDVPEDAVITATFSTPVNASSATNSNFLISNSDSGETADYSVTASGSVVTITPTAGWDAGSRFNISLSNSISGTNGVAYSGNDLSFRTAGIFVPMSDAQVLAIDFDGSSAVDEAGGLTVNTVGTLSYTEDRRGTANGAAYFDGQGNLVEISGSDDLIPGSATISFWFKSDLSDYDGGADTGNPQTRFVMGLGVERGYFLEIGRRSNDPSADAYGETFLKYATNHVNIGNNGSAVPKATAWSEINSQINVNYSVDDMQSGWSFSIDELRQDPPNRDFVTNQTMGKWTHLVLVFDATMQTKTFYIDGEKWATFTWLNSGTDWLFSDLSLKTENNDGSAVEGIVPTLALGFAGAQNNTSTGWANWETHNANPAESKKFFKGAIDQFRIFDISLSDADVSELYNNEK